MDKSKIKAASDKFTAMEPEGHIRQAEGWLAAATSQDTPELVASAMHASQAHSLLAIAKKTVRG